MQAIIMAAGKGSRIEELTGGNPKSFLEINGKKLIEYNLDMLRDIGVDKIVIVTGYRDDAFRELTKNMSDVILKYNPFYSLVNVLGSFYMGMDELDDDFIFMHADTLCDRSIFDELMKLKADVNLPVDYKVCDEEAMKVRSKNGKIVEITKQMPVEAAEGEFIGVALFRKGSLNAVKQKTKEVLADGEFASYFEGAIQRMIDDTELDIRAFDIKDAPWVEVDFKEDYERAVELFGDYDRNKRLDGYV